MPDFAKYRGFILCEDREHANFVRSFLKLLGVNERKFTTDKFVDGGGSAEAHVRFSLPDALEKIRRKDENTFLVVVTDADRSTHRASDRIKQLNEELENRGFRAIEKNDRVLFVIPKKNIETWFAWVDEGETIDEVSDYKQRYRNVKAAQYGKKFHQKYVAFRNDGTDCDNAPGSIRDMCAEFVRFCDALDIHEERRRI